MYSVILFVLSFACSVHKVKNIDIKTWRSNTNFDNPQNWEKHRLPCNNDRVVFEASSPVAVYMPEAISVGELILPLNGELIFPPNAVLNVTGGHEPGSCVGQDAHFRTGPWYWHDPANWNITSGHAFPRVPSRRNAAVPHAFQVPCPHDRVVFPPAAAFRVYLIRHDTRISYLQINNVEFSQSSFDGLTYSPTGKLLFPDEPQIAISPLECVDETGCICNNDELEIFPTICTFTVPCPDLECYDPIEVEGHCCPICATQITAKYNGRFRMEKVLQLFQRYYNQREYFVVDSFIAKTYDSDIQSVFVSKAEDNDKAKQLAQLLYNAFTTDSTLGLISVTITKSEKWKIGDRLSLKDSSSSGLASGAIATIVLLLFALVIAAAYYIYKKRTIPGFSFARFDLSSDKIELQLGTTPHEELEPDEPAGERKQAFDNPTYETPAASQASSDIHDDEEGNDFVENPMFRIYEESSVKDKE